MEQLTKLSLFSGIGGDDLASDWANIKTLAMVEINPFCQQVLHSHWPNVQIIGDVKNVKKEMFQSRIDIVSGGFPCQDVSTAGLRKGIQEDTRSGLWGEYSRIISEVKPRWVVVENVRGLLSIDDGGGMRGILRDFTKLGYHVGWCVLRATTYGAKHQRERVFIVANSYCDRRLTLLVQERIYKQVISKRFFYDTHLLNYLQGFAPNSPTSLRAIDGIPPGLDEIKKRVHALGNAVVPQQIYPIYKTIVEIESKLRY